MYINDPNLCRTGIEAPLIMRPVTGVVSLSHSGPSLGGEAEVKSVEQIALDLPTERGICHLPASCMSRRPPT